MKNSLFPFAFCYIFKKKLHFIFFARSIIDIVNIFIITLYILLIEIN